MTEPDSAKFKFAIGLVVLLLQTSVHILAEAFHQLFSGGRFFGIGTVLDDRSEVVLRRNERGNWDERSREVCRNQILVRRDDRVTARNNSQVTLKRGAVDKVIARFEFLLPLCSSEANNIVNQCLFIGDRDDKANFHRSFDEDEVYANRLLRIDAPQKDRQDVFNVPPLGNPFRARRRHNVL